MKFSINKRLRITLIAVLVIAIGGISFLLYRRVKYPGVEEQKITLYTYNNKGSVDYRVYLKPNDIYNIDILDAGQIYITEFVDYINANFKYEFSGDKAAELKGGYRIIAKVQGYTVDNNDNIINIWEKNFIVIPSKSFDIDDEKKFIEESIDINLDNYNAFVTKVIEDSKVNCQTSLNIIMDINIKGKTGVGTIEDNLSPNIVIPLNTTMFEINGDTNIEDPGVIEETNRIQLPVNRNQVIAYGIIIAILASALAFLIFFTEVMKDKDLFKKKLRQIFKKHGDRFVALNNQISITYESANRVKSMDDLVRVADEIGKPIMYKYSSDYKDINNFYVIDEDEVYMLDLNEMYWEEKSSKVSSTSKR